MPLIPFGLSPLFLFGMTAALVATAYFFRRRSKVVEVPAVTVWLRFGRPVHVRSIGAVITSLPSLLAQFVIVGMVVLAMWNPFAPPRGPDRVAIVIDQSATMQTQVGDAPGGLSRFDVAVRTASDFLRQLRPDAQVTLVFATVPPLAPEPASTPAEAMARLRTSKPDDVDGDVRTVTHSLRYFASDAAASVVVYSDFVGTDLASIREGWTGPGTLSLVPVSSEQLPDAAIVNAWMRPERGDVRVGVRVASKGFDGRDVPVRLSVDGRDVDRGTCRLSDTVAGTIEFVTRQRPGARLEIVVDTSDALTVSDRVCFVIPATRRQIVLVTRGNPPLLAALSADPGAAVTVVSPDRFDGRADGVIVIMDDTCTGRLTALDPDVRSGNASAMNARGVLLIGTDDPLGRIAVGTPVLAPPVTSWMGSHPMFAGVAPDLIPFAELFTLNSLSGPRAEVALSAGDLPVIVESSLSGETKMIYWLFTLSHSELPQRVAFPVLLWNTIDYLSGDSDAQTQPLTGKPVLAHDAGDKVATTRPTATVTTPDGRSLPAERRPGVVRFSETRKAGFYEFDGASGSSTVAVNYLSERPLQSVPLQDRPIATVGDSSGTWATFSWKTVVLLALFAMVVEWALFRRGMLNVGSF